MQGQELRLADLRAAVRRRGKAMALTAGAVMLVMIFVAAILPNRYEASTTLLIEPQSISRRLVEAGYERDDLSNRLHLMTMQILSRARLSRVIDDLGLYADLSEEMTREEVIEYMRSQIWIEPVLPELTGGRRNQATEINTFRLFFRHERPDLAAAVANRLANDFIDEHIRDRVRVAGDTAEFIEGELTRLANRIREVETQIAQVKAENVGSLPEDRLSNQAQMEHAMQAIRFAQQRLAEAESDIGFYRQQAATARLEGERGDVVGRAVSPARRLQELEMALSGFKARGFTDRHPDVITARAEIEQLRKRLAEGDEGPVPASLAEQEALAQAARAELRAEANRQELQRLQQVVAQAQERLAATPRVAEQLEALQREWYSLNESFQSFSAKRLEANVAANMERRQKGEQFRVLEAAFPPPAPTSPNRIVILLVGLFLAVAMGAGVGLLLEATDSSYHEPRTLQQDLRIPVLAAIPGIVLEAERRAQRRRRRREIFAAAAVTGVVLLASAGGYVYVNMPGLWGGESATAVAPTPPAGMGAPAATEPPAGPRQGG